MKRSTLIALISLLVAVTGTVIALAAYLNHKKCKECDDLDDEFFYDDDEDEIEYCATQIRQEEECGCGCCGGEQKEASEVAPATEEPQV